MYQNVSRRKKYQIKMLYKITMFKIQNDNVKPNKVCMYPGTKI